MKAKPYLMKAQMFNFSTWVEETNPENLKIVYLKILKDAGFGILQIVDHYFEPQGYTLLALLSESHFAIHTFPEHNLSYLELSSCIKNQFDTFLNLYYNEQQKTCTKE